MKCVAFCTAFPVHLFLSKSNKIFVYLLIFLCLILKSINCSNFTFRAAGDTVELVVGCAATMDLLRYLEVEVTREILENWPSSDLLRIPDFSNVEDFFKVVAAAAVVSAVTAKVFISFI